MAMSQLEQEIIMRNIRPRLPENAIYGSQRLYADQSALVGEIGHPSCIGKYWDLTSGIIFISPDRFVMTTESAEDRWQAKFDSILQDLPEEGVTRRRWKAPGHGGQPFISPSATTNQLAATRRTRRTKDKPQALQAITEVEVVGALKVEEHMVIQSLMGHLSRQANIELREAGGEQGVKTGTWTWMGRIDPSASAGRSRIYLQNQAEVQTVKATLDGRTIKVGTDSFLVRVHNDLDIRKSRGLGPQ